MRSILILLLAVAATAHAQDPHRRRDTIPFGQWQQEITRAPVLTGGSQPIIIVPNRQPYCFDKLLSLKMTIGRLSTEQSIYLDTRNGLTGILPPSRSGGAITEIMPELENFTFTVMSLKGNVYIYKNQKDKNGIGHLVRTGNTQNFLYQSPTLTNPGAGAGLARKAERRGYCNNKVTALAYRYDGNPNTFFVYGDRFPERLHPLKYMGAFGVGYMYCQEGLFLIMEVNFGTASYVRIGDMENVHNCFDPSEFQVAEDKFQANQQRELQEEQASADRKQQQVTGECTGEKQAIVDYKRAMIDKHAELLRKSQHGNTYTDTATQRAIVNMMDPLDGLRENILVIKLNICQSQVHGGGKVSCLSNQLSILQDAEARMMALDSRYPTEPARAQTEKSKIYWDLMKNLVQCN